MARTDPIRRALEARLELLPTAAAATVREALGEPERTPWLQLVLAVLARVDPARVVEIGPAQLRLEPDLTIELIDGTPDPIADEVVAGLDRVFGGDAWLLRLRRSLPGDLDLAPIRQSLRLWLTARTTSRVPPSTVTYDHSDVSLEFTRLDGFGGGHCLTLGPRAEPPLEALDRGSASVLAVRSGHRFSRHAVQVALYGRATVTRSVSGPEPVHESELPRGGWFAEHDQVAEVWWIDPHPAPLGTLWRCTSPWTTSSPDVVAADRTCRATADGHRVRLQWKREGER